MSKQAQLAHRLTPEARAIYDAAKLMCGRTGKDFRLNLDKLKTGDFLKEPTP